MIVSFRRCSRPKGCTGRTRAPGSVPTRGQQRTTNIAAAPSIVSVALATPRIAAVPPAWNVSTNVSAFSARRSA
jgi:hypothetical protein